MKKIRLIIVSFLVFSTLLTPIKSYATEIDTTEEAVEEITEIETEVEATTEATTEETTQTENNDNSEIITEELQETQVPNETLTQQSETTQATTSSYGWLKFVPEIIEVTNDAETIIEFEFTNKETNEIITKQISSSDNFSNVVKLPLGEYSVKLTNDQFEDYVIYEKNIVIDKKEVSYSVSINITNTSESTEEVDIEKEKENAALDLLKNNFVFLILLLGCGGFLLIRELKKND